MNGKDWIHFCDKYDLAISTPDPSLLVRGLLAVLKLVASYLLITIILFLTIVPIMFLWRTIPYLVLLMYTFITNHISYSWIREKTIVVWFQRLENKWLERIKELCADVSSEQESLMFYVKTENTAIVISTNTGDYTGTVNRYYIEVTIAAVKEADVAEAEGDDPELGKVNQCLLQARCDVEEEVEIA